MLSTDDLLEADERALHETTPLFLFEVQLLYLVRLYFFLKSSRITNRGLFTLFVLFLAKSLAVISQLKTVSDTRRVRADSRVLMVYRNGEVEHVAGQFSCLGDNCCLIVSESTLTDESVPQLKCFIYSREKGTFYKLPYPSKETFGCYLNNTGYNTDAQVQIAADKWGRNVIEYPQTPLLEQSTAWTPSFCLSIAFLLRSSYCHDGGAAAASGDKSRAFQLQFDALRADLQATRGLLIRRPPGGSGGGGEHGLIPRSMRLDVPKFTGADPDAWLFAIQEYFTLLNTPADQRLRIVGFNSNIHEFNKEERKQKAANLTYTLRPHLSAAI
ncbi:hypothetical protein Tco_1514450 [Tanacetum coccineum]